MSTQQDHDAIRDGFTAHFNRAPSESEALVLHAVAYYETRMGRGWASPEGRAAKNLGAIQYKTPKQLGLSKPYPAISPDGKGFLYTDTSPNSDGTSSSYSVYFRIYESLADGARALARMVYEVNGRAAVLEAARQGDVFGVSSAMHTTRYYEGWGATVADRIRHHYQATMGALNKICRDLGKRLPNGQFPPPRTLKRGAQGEDVKELQRLLGLVADGIFGPATEASVKEFQATSGLKADGIVGAKTWDALKSQAAPSDPPEPAPPEEPPVEPAQDLKLALRGVSKEEAEKVITALSQALS